MPTSPFDAERCLRHHAAPLRALAADLVRDPALADDVVQETWLQVLQGPPGHEAAVGGWLFVALRNVARRWWRAERRRTRREGFAAPAEAVADHAVVLAREEVLRRVVAAVAALAEPYRDTVWQRYFEARSPRVIAARQGVPVATVKSRLQRGLGQLRATLGAEGGADWRAGLGFAFGFADGAAAAAGAAAVWQGALVMATWGKSAAAVLLAAVALWWLWPVDPRPSEQVPGTQDRVAAAAETAAPSRVAMPEVTRREPAATAVEPAPAAAEPTATLRGRLVDAVTAEPLAGVALSVDNHTKYVTGADGRFVVTVPAPRPDGLAAVDVQDPERPASRSRPASRPQPTRLEAIRTDRIPRRWDSGVPLAAGQVEELGDLPMRRGYRIRGRVVEEQGAPVPAEAFLAVEFQPVSPTLPWNEAGGGAAAYTDAEGRFEVRTAVPPGALRLRIPFSSVELVSPKEVVVGAEDIESLTVIVRQRPQIRGVVVDETGAPLARIGLGTQAFFGDSPSAADGTFVLTKSHSAASGEATVFVTHVGLCDPHEPIPGVAWGTADLRIVLRRSVPFAIEVVGADGTPIEEFGITDQRAGELWGGKVRLRGSHAGGRLTVDSVTRGQTSLRVLPTGVEWTPSELVPLGLAEPLRIVLQRRVPGTVQVVAAGKPVAGALVELIHERYPLTAATMPFVLDPRTGDQAWVSGLWSELVASGHTDAGGLAPLSRDVELDQRVLRVRAAGRPVFLQRSLVFPADGQPLRLALPESGVITGTVALRGRDRQQVRVQIRSAAQTESCVPQPDGSFASPPLIAGSYEVVLELRGSGNFQPVPGALYPVTVGNGTPTPVQFDLGAVPTATLDGVVEVPGGVPAGLQVELVRQHAGAEMLSEGGFAVAADGSFRAKDLPPGSYRVAFRLPAQDRLALPAVQAETISLRDGEALARRFRFEPRRLVVRLVLPDGTSAKGQRVRGRSGGCVWPAVPIFCQPVDELLVLDPAPATPIEFALQDMRAPWSVAVQMPQDRAAAELTVVLPAIAPTAVR